MESSEPQETNGNHTAPHTSEANGNDMPAALNSPSDNNNEYSVTQETHTQITSDKHETIAPNNNNNKANDEKPTQDLPPPRNASPPTEHKQHLTHLPLRKRHLLASSTGSNNHNEHTYDNNNTNPTHIQPVSHTNDYDSSTAHHNDPETHTTTTERTDSTPKYPPEPPETTHSSVIHDTHKPHATPPRLDFKGFSHTTNNIHEHHKEENGALRSSQDRLTDTHKLSHSGAVSPKLSSHSPRSIHLQHPFPNQTQHSNSNNQHPHSNQTNNPSSQYSHQSSSQQYPSYSQQHSQSKSHTPSSTHSPTGSYSPRSHSPIPQSGRPTSNRGRGGGRGRGRSSKVEGAVASSSHSSSSGAGEEIYCFCRRPYDPTVDVFMICCDACDEWYHGSCVNINQREAKKIGRYVCPRCKKTPTSPTVSSEASSDSEPSSPPTTKNKKRKNDNSSAPFKGESFKTEPKRQALSPAMPDNGVVC